MWKNFEGDSESRGGGPAVVLPEVEAFLFPSRSQAMGGCDIWRECHAGVTEVLRRELGAEVSR